MEDREFSSPVCMLDCDSIEPIAREPVWRICGKCRAVLDAFVSSNGSTKYSIGQYYGKVLETWSPIETAMAQGCPVCLLLFNNFPPNDFVKPVSTIYSRHTFTLTDPNPLAMLTCKSYYTRKGEQMPRYDKDLQVVLSEDFEGVNEEFLGHSTASSYSTTIFSKWIIDCATLHERCQRKSEFLPTRLVDVGFGELPKVRLVLSRTLPVSTRYLTLSHCWGQSVPQKLLMSNIESLMEEIQVSKLSQTFKDAMIVTRQVDKRYIWIDSLCIIQDDKHDWQRESSTVGQIYSISYCNISATGSDGSTGLFSIRNLPSLGQCKISVNSNGKQGTYYVWDHESWEREVENSPLSRRGWVLQERFLSPCNLHFGARRLFWECNQLCASEEFPLGIPKRFDVYTGRKRDISASLRLFMENPSLYVGAPPMHIWETLLSKYTASKLTYSGDKLVAIGGLAALLGKASKYQYMAGLWKERLPGELLWYAEKPCLDYANRQYTAPSWSWASIEARIQSAPVTPDPYTHVNSPVFLVKVIDVKVELAGDDIYGQVKDGVLTMGARLAQIRYSDIRNLDLKWCWDIPVRDIEDADEGNIGPFLVPVSETSRFETGIKLEGLVLKATKGRFGEFRRVGTFESTEETLCRVWEACVAFDKLDTGLEYDIDEERRRLYTITLI